MKAVICTKYGPPEVLQIKEVQKPVPNDNEMLVKVFATTVTAGDCRMRSFTVPPLFWLAGRLALGFTKPKQSVLGMELSGKIESIGKNVRHFKVGDDIYASTFNVGFGAYAEYKCLPEDGMVALKPDNLNYEEAAAVPYGANTALYFLRKGDIKKGDEILIYGASGTVGTFAVQLAKYFGAEVTAVCSGGNFELVKSLGADEVIDYTKEDFTKNGLIYDIIFDTVGKTRFANCKNSLKKKGFYLNTVIVMAGIKGVWYSLTTGRNFIGGTASEDQEDLVFLKKLIEEGKIKPVVEKIYSLDEIIEVHRYADTGHKKGSVAISIKSEGMKR